MILDTIIGLLPRFAIDILIVLIIFKWAIRTKRRRRKYLRAGNIFRIAVVCVIVFWAIPQFAGRYISPRLRYFPQYVEAHKLRLYYLVWAVLPGKNATQSEIEQYIRSASAEYGLSPALVKAVVQVESGFDQYALSVTGACGLMQLMPNTYFSLAWANPFSARANIYAGTKYLKRLHGRFNGNTRLAVAAYNAGPSPVKRCGGVPPIPETQNYVRLVMAHYAQFNR